MLSKREIFLTSCIRASLGDDPEDHDKYEVSKYIRGTSLDPEYNPFDMLQMELMTHRLRKEHFGDAKKES
tara:strand:+ start:111420 stop:111629 length:210 start_codon:yes stop_codon:yes gene_type:complete